MKMKFPQLNLNFVQDLIPEDPPENPENWDTIMDDVEKKIMVGVSKNFRKSSLKNNYSF